MCLCYACTYLECVRYVIKLEHNNINLGSSMLFNSIYVFVIRMKIILQFFLLENYCTLKNTY